MNRQSNKFEPSKLSRVLIPVLLLLLTLGLLTVVLVIILSLSNLIP
jgi:hypothetical protein